MKYNKSVIGKEIVFIKGDWRFATGKTYTITSVCVDGTPDVNGVSLCGESAIDQYLEGIHWKFTGNKQNDPLTSIEEIVNANFESITINGKRCKLVPIEE